MGSATVNIPRTSVKKPCLKYKAPSMNKIKKKKDVKTYQIVESPVKKV